MEVESWAGAGPSALAGASFQNTVVNQTNVLNEACVFGNVNNQQVINEARMVTENTINVAEERHSHVMHVSAFAHQQEVERGKARRPCGKRG